MPHRRRTLFAGIGVLLGLFATSTGCDHLGITGSADVTPVAAADPAPPGVAEKRAVAEAGEPVRRPQPTMVAVAGWLPLSPPEAPPAVPPVPDWRAAPPGGDTHGKTVIASNWRPMERSVVAPAQATVSGQPGLSPLAVAEFPGAPAAPVPPPVLTVPQVPPKPDDKPGEKAGEKQPEQMPAPTVLPAPEAPAASAPAAAPVLGMPIAGGAPGGPGGPSPRELCKVSLPPYVIEPPDVLLIESTQGLKDQPIRGQHLVRPDGTVSLGMYGSVHVAGMTIEQAKEAIIRVLRRRITDATIDNLNVDVIAYNSKFYYVITDGGGYGEQVYRLPIYGSETVLDAIGQINGLPPVASKRHIWLARRAPGHGVSQMPVDWIAITQYGSTETNYQVLPGDHIYVRAEKLIKIDSGIAKELSPIERVLGAVLLGSSTVNSINNRNGGNNTNR
jgi:polysaccharide export outer membrane protein